ncbi:MAG: hypothetical protein WAO35_27305 [Terriglobia bacterium]
MITNESEIRVALQAMLMCALAFWGFWSCAVVLFILLVPWRPFLAVSWYLVKPIVDWRQHKAHRNRDKGVARIEKELDAFLTAPRDKGQILPQPIVAKSKVVTKPPKREPRRPLRTPQSYIPGAPVFQNLTVSAQNLLDTLAIPSEIEGHIRNLPQGAFSNMNLEVEEVKFIKDIAEACVKFQSPHGKELAIRQRYILRKSGGQWKVESLSLLTAEANFHPILFPPLEISKRGALPGPDD